MKLSNVQVKRQGNMLFLTPFKVTIGLQYQTKHACSFKSSRPKLFCKKGLLKNSQIHKKTPVPESLFLIKPEAEAATLLKKRLCWHLRFPVSFKKPLTAPFYRTHLVAAFTVFGQIFISKHPSSTFSLRKTLSYRNQSIDLKCKSIDWFLYDRNLRHKRVK